MDTTTTADPNPWARVYVDGSINGYEATNDPALLGLGEHYEHKPRVLPHTAAQPGLRGHSINPDDNLLKRYIVSHKTPSGWLVDKSFDTPGEGSEYISENGVSLWGDMPLKERGIRLTDTGTGPRPEPVILEDWTAV